jgi:hypothetical protein
MFSQTYIDPEKVAEERLWTAVIARTVEEWVSGPARSRQEAEEYLFRGGEDFNNVCRFAGLNPEAFQNRLTRYKKHDAEPAPTSPANSLKH